MKTAEAAGRQNILRKPEIAQPGGAVPDFTLGMVTWGGGRSGGGGGGGGGGSKD